MSPTTTKRRRRSVRSAPCGALLSLRLGPFSPRLSSTAGRWLVPRSRLLLGLHRFSRSSIGHCAQQYFIELAAAVRSADEFRFNTPAANTGTFRSFLFSSLFPPLFSPPPLTLLHFLDVIFLLLPPFLLPPSPPPPPPPHTHTARKLLDRYVEERMDPATKRKLEEALAAKDLRLLEAVLRICESNGYQTSIVRQCQELYERIQDAEAALAVAVQECNEGPTRRALQLVGVDVRTSVRSRPLEWEHRA